VVLSQTKSSGEATRRAAGAEKTGGLRSRSASAETRWAEPPPQANAQSESGRCLLRCLLRQGYEGQDAAVWRYRAVVLSQTKNSGEATRPRTKDQGLRAAI
jgi:hypothetical protein